MGLIFRCIYTWDRLGIVCTETVRSCWRMLSQSKGRAEVATFILFTLILAFASKAHKVVYIGKKYEKITNTYSRTLAESKFYSWVLPIEIQLKVLFSAFSCQIYPRDFPVLNTSVLANCSTCNIHHFCHFTNFRNRYYISESISVWCVSTAAVATTRWHYRGMISLGGVSTTPILHTPTLHHTPLPYPPFTTPISLYPLHAKCKKEEEVVGGERASNNRHKIYRTEKRKRKEDRKRVEAKKYKFIKLVRQYPMLYDVVHSDQIRGAIRKVLWGEIIEIYEEADKFIHNKRQKLNK